MDCYQVAAVFEKLLASFEQRAALASLWRGLFGMGDCCNRFSPVTSVFEELGALVFRIFAERDALVLALCSMEWGVLSYRLLLD